MMGLRQQDVRASGLRRELCIRWHCANCGRFPEEIRSAVPQESQLLQGSVAGLNWPLPGRKLLQNVARAFMCCCRGVLGVAVGWVNGSEGGC